MVPLRAALAAAKLAKNQRFCLQRNWLRSLSSEPPRLPKSGAQNAALSNKMEASGSGKGGPCQSSSIATENSTYLLEDNKQFNNALIMDLDETAKKEMKFHKYALEELKNLSTNMEKEAIHHTSVMKGQLTLLLLGLSMGGSYFMLSLFVLVHKVMEILS